MYIYSSNTDATMCCYLNIFLFNVTQREKTGNRQRMLSMHKVIYVR